MITNRLLKKIQELTSMSKESVDLLLLCAQQIELSKGQYLLREGQICNFLYFVEEGFLRSYINQEDSEINIDFTFEGTFVSNLRSLKKQEPSQFCIVAGENALVTLFNKDMLLEFYSQFAEIELFCRRIMGFLLLESNEHLIFYRLNKPKERYQYLMKNNPQMIQRIPISQLSSYIGIARETLSRIRNIKT